MASQDKQPLSGLPQDIADLLRQRHQNRLGAVYSSLYSFWKARHTAIPGATNRRDAYSVILFDESAVSSVNNDLTSGPEDLLDKILGHHAGGGTKFTAAIQAAQDCIVNYWNAER